MTEPFFSSGISVWLRQVEEVPLGDRVWVRMVLHDRLGRQLDERHARYGKAFLGLGPPSPNRDVPAWCAQRHHSRIGVTIRNNGAGESDIAHDLVAAESEPAPAAVDAAATAAAVCERAERGVIEAPVFPIVV